MGGLTMSPRRGATSVDAGVPVDGQPLDPAALDAAMRRSGSRHGQPARRTRSTSINALGMARSGSTSSTVSASTGSSSTDEYGTEVAVHGRAR